MDYYLKNLEALKRVDESLADKVDSLVVDTGKYCVVQTKNAQYTIKSNYIEGDRKCEFYLHSKYDPEKEAANFAQSQLGGKAPMYLLYGFGLGYHVEKLLDNLSKDNLLYIAELNLEIFKLALQTRDVAHILSDKRVLLIISDDEQWVAAAVAQIVKEDVKVMIYMPCIKAIPDRNGNFRTVIEHWNLKRYVAERRDSDLWNNYYENVKLNVQNVGVLFNHLKGIPVIIVSAGPSLNKNKHLLKALKGKALIFAVGSALKPLLQIGVEPDMFCTIDPLPITYAQIAGCEELNIPFVFLDTASSLIVSAYEGPKFITCNDKTRLGEKEEGYIIDTGGSVATAIMDMAIKFGGNPIIFIGQDLAFAGSERHAENKMYGYDERELPVSDSRKVKGQSGVWLNTSSGYLIFKKWIENKIKDYGNIEFINATEGGAFIEGCRHIKLQAFIDNYMSNIDLVNQNENSLKEFMDTVLEKATYDKRNEIKVLTFNILVK